MDRTEEWRVFVAVAGRRSFVEAARALRRSPQAITRAVAALEQRLGARLLNRTTRSVSVTGEGERYLERGRRVLAELDALESAPDARAPLAGPAVDHRARAVRPASRGAAGVRASSSSTRRSTPGCCWSTASCRWPRRASTWPCGSVPLPDSSLRARLVGHVRWVVCASPAYLARAGVPRTPEALARHACISFDAGSPLADHWTFPRAGGRERTRRRAAAPDREHRAGGDRRGHRGPGHRSRAVVSGRAGARGEEAAPGPGVVRGPARADPDPAAARRAPTAWPTAFVDFAAERLRARLRTR